jgi:hydrogenase maturation protease
MTVRLIGVGNPLRGDDGAGVAVALQVRAAVPTADVRTCDGGAVALLDAWDGAQEIIVIDAASTGAPVGTVVELPPGSVVRARRGAGTHDAGLADAIELATALDLAPERLTVFLVEGADFRLGHPLSPAVQAAVDALARRLAAELDVTWPEAG